jgi:predicted nucleic acid-binding protein
MLADTNLIIYSVKPAYGFIRDWFETAEPAASAVSYVEALGYWNIKPDEERDLTEFFASTDVLPLNDAVLKQAVKLRQSRSMGLGDALLAATALVHGLTLATHNTADFAWVPNLSLFDPFDQQPKNQLEEGA